MLVSTKQAAELVGLSAYELRQGWKSGRYPALEIGTGERARLRWDVGQLQEVIRQQMAEAMDNRAKAAREDRW